ncbi:C40 family peptidase, partial [Seonamhaeicola marinus]
IRLDFDAYEGWIDNKQYIEILEENYKQLQDSPLKLSLDLVEFIQDTNNQLHPILLGSCLSGLQLLNHTYDGNTTQGQIAKENIITTAFSYLNAPYLWGGKTPFGIDCSGFTQMVYKLNGYKLLRDASQQATQGEALSFIEESEPGDLAF